MRFAKGNPIKFRPGFGVAPPIAPVILAKGVRGGEEVVPARRDQPGAVQCEPVETRTRLAAQRGKLGRREVGVAAARAEVEIHDQGCRLMWVVPGPARMYAVRCGPLAIRMIALTARKVGTPCAS
jgi:hypothetical protein